MWLGWNDTRVLESGVATTKNQRGGSLQKDRDMGVNPRATDGTLKPMIKQGSIWNHVCKQPIFGDLKEKGTDLENMAESARETQTSYSAKLLL